MKKRIQAALIFAVDIIICPAVMLFGVCSLGDSPPTDIPIYWKILSWVFVYALFFGYPTLTLLSFILYTLQPKDQKYGIYAWLPLYYLLTVLGLAVIAASVG